MQNYEALEAGTGRAGLTMAVSEKPDLVLLDWELPDITGIEVCRELRRSGMSVPILMLTGRGDDRDIVTGLEHGIDEYLTKPVRPRVLAARLAANLRRFAADADRAQDETPDHLALLDRVSLFLQHPPGALRVIARKAVSVRVPKGTVALEQGMSNPFLYVIQSGSFDVSTASSPGQVSAVARLGEADFFGAISVLTGEKAHATVVAHEDSMLVRVAGDDLLEELVADSDARKRLESVVAQRRARLQHIRNRGVAPPEAEARIVSVYSPKGGVGKTTLALNVAATLAREHWGQVLLVDFSLPYNHAAVLAHLSPSSSLARVAGAAVDFDQHLQSAIVTHGDGFLVLSTVLAPEEADLITPELVDRALQALTPEFGYIVFDLGVVLSEAALSVMERSDVICLVATPELVVIKDLIRVYRILQDVLKLAAGQIHLVVNHRSSHSALGRRDIKEVLGVEVAVEIRHDGRRPEKAALAGEILAKSAAKSPVAKGAAEVARLIRKSRA
jgi:Flp pilus assembly CpaE family ATPase